MDIVSLRDQLAEAEASKAESRQRLGTAREDIRRVEEVIAALEQDVDTARMCVSLWQPSTLFLVCAEGSPPWACTKAICCSKSYIELCPRQWKSVLDYQPRIHLSTGHCREAAEQRARAQKLTAVAERNAALSAELAAVRELGAQAQERAEALEAALEERDANAEAEQLLRARVCPCA
jgi:hypothetical protein